MILMILTLVFNFYGRSPIDTNTFINHDFGDNISKHVATPYHRPNTAWDDKYTSFSGFYMVLLPLIVNVPQAVLSVVFIGLNKILTRMAMSAEYAQFALERKPLRVTVPTGSQRSSYFLNIPLKFALPNLVAWTFLHWLASEMYFSIVTRDYSVYYPLGRFQVEAGVYTSTFALWAFLGLGFFIITVCMLLGLRIYPENIPFTYGNTAVISAACHPDPNEPDNAAEMPLMYGRRQNEHGESTCSFSAQSVELIEPGEESELTFLMKMKQSRDRYKEKVARALGSVARRRKEDSDNNRIILEEINHRKDSLG